jgi:hypothetical protein
VGKYISMLMGGTYYTGQNLTKSCNVHGFLSRRFPYLATSIKISGQILREVDMPMALSTFLSMEIFSIDTPDFHTNLSSWESSGY